MENEIKIQNLPIITLAHSVYLTVNLLKKGGNAMSNPKVLVEHYYKDVGVNSKKKDFEDWMIFTWDKPLFAIGRSNINWLQDYGDFDHWDLIQAYTVGWRSASKKWYKSNQASLENFDNCTGIAFTIRALMDVRLYVSLEVSLYVELAKLPNLKSSYTVNPEGWKEITHDEAGRMGLH
jgi:hypothetical protein